MRNRGVRLGAACVVLVGLSVWAASRVPAVQDALLERAVETLIARDASGLMADDALRLVLCGTSAPLPEASRAKACSLVIAGGKFYVVDVGPEAVENLLKWRLPMHLIGGVFLTHFHSDHIGGLGELNMQSWARGRPAALAVYGPPGVEKVVAGFVEAYRFDQIYRSAYHGLDIMPREAWNMVAVPVALHGEETSARDRTAVAFRAGDLAVTAIEVNHAAAKPAYGYRFDYKGRSIVISGDTAKHPPLAAAAENADILLHEAQSKQLVDMVRAAVRAAGQARLYKIFSDIQRYHTSPVEAAAIANAGHVKLLILTHFNLLPLGSVAKSFFTRGVDEARDGEWDLGKDGRLYELPIGTDGIRTSDIDS